MLEIRAFFKTEFFLVKGVDLKAASSSILFAVDRYWEYFNESVEKMIGLFKARGKRCLS